jgi:hypothetical protein
LGLVLTEVDLHSASSFRRVMRLGCSGYSDDGVAVVGGGQHASATWLIVAECAAAISRNASIKGAVWSRLLSEKRARLIGGNLGDQAAVGMKLAGQKATS